MTYDKEKIFDEASIKCTPTWLTEQIKDAKKKLNRPGMRDISDGEFQKISGWLELIYSHDYKIVDTNHDYKIGDTNYPERVRIVSVNTAIQFLIEYIVKCENKIESMKANYHIPNGGGSWVALREGETLDDVLDSLHPEEDEK